MSRPTVLLLNGPNLNLLGTREPHLYGNTTLPDLEAHLASLAATHGLTLQSYQSNHEGLLLDRIHAARRTPQTNTHATSQAHEPADAIIVNAGALTHTSVALRDALVAVDVPFVEVHVTNVYARESFRHHSYLSDKARAVVAGLGVFGYEAALAYWARDLGVDKGASV